jgi:hypothetical protein
MVETLEDTMNTTPCTVTIPLVRPWHQRVLDTSLADVVSALQRAWREHAQRGRHERELRAVADMNELMLRDIGAPDWMLAEAIARRHAVEVASPEQAVAWLRGWQ